MVVGQELPIPLGGPGVLGSGEGRPAAATAFLSCLCPGPVGWVTAVFLETGWGRGQPEDGHRGMGTRSYTGLLGQR